MSLRIEKCPSKLGKIDVGMDGNETDTFSA